MWLQVRGGAVNSLDVDQVGALVDECEAHRLGLVPGALGAEVSGDGWVAEAMLEANRSRDEGRGVSLRFVEAIVDRWRQEGFGTRMGRSGGGSGAVGGGSVGDRPQRADRPQQASRDRPQRAKGARSQTSPSGAETGPRIGDELEVV